MAEVVAVFYLSVLLGISSPVLLNREHCVAWVVPFKFPVEPLIICSAADSVTTDR